MQINITRVNISSPNGCQVKNEICKEEAYWFINHKMSVCGKHLKAFCEAVGIDYDGIVKESEKVVGND